MADFNQNFNLNVDQFAQDQDFLKRRSPDITEYQSQREQLASLLNQQDQQRELQSQFQNRQITEQSQQAKQNLLAQQTSRGLAGSGLGAQQLGALQGQTELAFTEKEQKEIAEKQLGRRENVQLLREQFTQKMVSQLNRNIQRDAKIFEANTRQFLKTAEGKFIQEQEDAVRRQEMDYAKTIAKITKRTQGVQTFNKIHQGLASLIGAISPVAGMFAQAGATTGQLVSQRVASGRNQDLINAFQQGRN